MVPDAPSLADAIGASGGSCVALIGAGGKTTAMLALAHDLRTLGHRVVVTTTTKIWPPEGLPVILDVQPNPDDRLRSALSRSPLVVWSHHMGGEGKLHGVAARRVCELQARGIADAIVCEADGAAGRSLKAHGVGEPVVPPCATHVVVVVGMDALGRAVDASTVHRLEDFCRITGSQPGDVITAPVVSRALLAAAEYVPAGAGLVYLLNKSDRPAVDSATARVIEELVASFPSAIVVRSRWGRPNRPAVESASPSLYSEYI